MTDFTPEELVRTAEYCGKRVEIRKNKVYVFVRIKDPSEWNKPDDFDCEPGSYYEEQWLLWHPPTIANQRDELVDKLLKDGYDVIQSADPNDDPPYECEINHQDEDGNPYRRSQLGQADTPGEAFFRAALAALGVIP